MTRQKLLHNSIPFIPKYGWSQQSILKSCKALGYPPSSIGHVKNIPFDLVDYYQRWILQQSINRCKPRMSQDFYKNISMLLETRLENIVPVASNWSEVSLYVCTKQYDFRQWE